MLERQTLLEKIYGSLMGVAVGDAMGMPCELWSRNKTKKVFGTIVDFLDASPENIITAGLKAGEVTDDTEQTVIVAEAIIESCGRILPEKIIDRIIKWSESEKVMKRNIIGPSTRRAFTLIKEGSSLEETGRFGETNGGSMRIIPVGIISDWRYMDELVENVRLCCLPTHNTNIAISGAAAIAGAISYALEGNSLEELIEVAKAASQKGMGMGYEIPGASVPGRIDLAVKIVKNGGSEENILQELYDIVGTGIQTTESVPAALALVVLSGGKPERCARLSANIGGGTDTIGAIACGICGALNGIKAFDKEHVKAITEANSINFEKISRQLMLVRMSNAL